MTKKQIDIAKKIVKQSKKNGCSIFGAINSDNTNCIKDNTEYYTDGYVVMKCDRRINDIEQNKGNAANAIQSVDSILTSVSEMTIFDLIGIKELKKKINNAKIEYRTETQKRVSRTIIFLNGKAINANYLIMAMEATGSNKLYNNKHVYYMKGNGVEFIILGINTESKKNDYEFIVEGDR